MRLKYLRNLLIFFLGFFLLLFLYSCKHKQSKYSFFIEFNDANGIMVGTPIRMRGIIIGVAHSIQLKLNCVLVLATIYSDDIIISKKSFIETTQTGLLNESVIDIVPLEYFNIQPIYSPLSVYCDSSKIICNNMYMVGDRGLNYDDLVRSTTRISQRFDDPHFFYLFYSFLHSSKDLIDSISLFSTFVFDTLDIGSKQIYKFFSQ